VSHKFLTEMRWDHIGSVSTYMDYLQMFNRVVPSDRRFEPLLPP
jgi:hypothetical protein